MPSALPLRTSRTDESGNRSTLRQHGVVCRGAGWVRVGWDRVGWGGVGDGGVAWGGVGCRGEGRHGVA